MVRLCWERAGVRGQAGLETGPPPQLTATGVDGGTIVKRSPPLWTYVPAIGKQFFEPTLTPAVCQLAQHVHQYDSGGHGAARRCGIERELLNTSSICRRIRRQPRYLTSIGSPEVDEREAEMPARTAEDGKFAPQALELVLVLPR